MQALILILGLCAGFCLNAAVERWFIRPSLCVEYRAHGSKRLELIISPQGLLVSAIAGAGFLLLYLKYGPGIEWGALSLYLLLLLAIAIVDLERRLIPNRLVYPALPLALLIATFYPLGAAAGSSLPYSTLYSLLGGAVAFVALLIPALVREGQMGFGDVKLAGLIGLITGFPGCLIALALAIFGAGGTSSVLLLLKRKRRQDTIPFGPFLSAGALAALVWGNSILSLYLRQP